MGNSESGKLKDAILNQDKEYLQYLLNLYSKDPSALHRPLNRRGDTALILSIRCGHFDLVKPLIAAGSSVHECNNLHENALDILALKICHSRELLPEQISALDCLLSCGADGVALHKLALHAKTLPVLCQLISTTTLYRDCSLCSLLLKLCAWYDMKDSMIKLLKTGVDLSIFWDVPFVKPMVPNPSYQTLSSESAESNEYSLPYNVPDSTVLESQKLCLLSDWRDEWEGGENLLAQYRAGLQLPPTAAKLFIQAANHGALLEKVMQEILRYLPPNCGGPSLTDYCLLECMNTAGYQFSEQETNKVCLTHDTNVFAFLKSSDKIASLKHLSRLCVRHAFLTNVVHAVDCLDSLPYSMKNYLLLSDITDSIYTYD